jgi:UDP:flavonoid glycosyltransferase YjiC (YdhE family)
VLLPQGADNTVNAALVERAGAGTVVPAEALTPEAVREALRRAMTEHVAAAARRVGGEVAAMPEQAEVAASLPTLVRP